ncbi:excalibur calcium-binding domain-containing protein [Bacillus sp. FJAT-49732]|uniref:Excalibur calcium-binding domain-containing protein n=1 Tax=Lederbergia citrisecunda TaxID=2833583 RepID=A0A942YMU1_9BACI|nr:excalibur calcium-binding domain-containing protein [Lederbergia citrisecunda]MBS4201859.1 excalibur calcium-binding domain-containing protein [Lederbergia citrisecunda]
MKKVIAVLLGLGLVFGLSTIDTVEAKQKVKTYKNCTALNKDYKGGVAKSSKVKNKGGKTKYKPFVSSSLYNANMKLDRDKDGIACEK